MGEAHIRVPFRDENGNLTYRDVYIDVNADDTLESIAPRVQEWIQEYLEFPTFGLAHGNEGLQPITRGGMPIYDVLSWPLF